MDEIKPVLCCDNCFHDDFLITFIQTNGKPNLCSFCEENSNYCIDPEELRELFIPLIGLYGPREDFMLSEDMEETDGNYIWEVLSDEWGIIDRSDKAEEIVKAIMGPDLRIYDSWVENEEEFMGEYLEVSGDLEKSWNQLREDLKHKNRFFNSELNELMEFLSILEFNIKSGENFYRARRCHKDKFLPSQMGSPPIDKARAGRGNPEGISYLYLASDSITALSEVKPYIEQDITVGTFSLKKNLKVIDLRIDKLFSPFRYGENIREALKARSLFFLLGRELSKPIEPQSRNSFLEYLPTQYLCELIKMREYDGILYKSTLGKGFNILLFSEANIVCEKTELYRVDGLNYSTHPISDEILKKLKDG